MMDTGTYHDTSSWDGATALSGGSRRIPISTPSGDFMVWTRRFGTNPDLKVLLLHGGPAVGCEYLEPLDPWLMAAGVEFYHYDQLGAFRSDQPDDPSLWTLERYVDEVEQVRTALGLGPDNMVLYGQSWGGLLALEYALTHPGTLKGLVISNMMVSCPAYNHYARSVLMPAMDQDVLAEVQAMEAEGHTDDPRYEELLVEHHYVHHVLRMPPEDWPDCIARAFAHLNRAVYVPMQGPSELGLSGSLENWDRSDRLGEIDLPTLVIGATHDTMDPKHMEWMAGELPQGRYLHCPDGSHLCHVDDPEVYRTGLLEFLLSL